MEKKIDGRTNCLGCNKENPSIESLRSYARLEVNSMEEAFLTEVVISGAPLVGLLGTVTGLVKVFSQIPAGG